MLTAGQAEKFKTGWRQRNAKIVEFWSRDRDARPARRSCSRATVHAVGGSGIAFICTGKTLQMRLPSGRVLYYHRPRLDMETGSIVYWGAEVGGQLGGAADVGRQIGGERHPGGGAGHHVGGDAAGVAAARAGAVHDGARRTGLRGRPRHALPGRCDGILKALMLEAPPWAGGLPLAGEHKIMWRYGVPATSR